jgi:hypothetical protein
MLQITSYNYSQSFFTWLSLATNLSCSTLNLTTKIWPLLRLNHSMPNLISLRSIVFHMKSWVKTTKFQPVCFIYEYFSRENVFKIVPVQVPTKLEMWQNDVAFVFVITYVLQVIWPYVVHILIIDHRPLLPMRVPHVCALTSSSGERGNWGLNSRSGRAKN